MSGTAGTVIAAAVAAAMAGEESDTESHKLKNTAFWTVDCNSKTVHGSQKVYA